MKINITKKQEIEVTTPYYFKTGYGVGKLNGDGTACLITADSSKAGDFIVVSIAKMNEVDHYPCDKSYYDEHIATLKKIVNKL